MTKSKDERKMQIEKLEEQNKRLREEIETLKKTESKKEEINKKTNMVNKNEELLQSFYSEPVGVLDKHEIRRSLTISITITYFVLLSLAIFKVGELNPESSMIKLFTMVFLVMIAFYFGSRAVEEGIKLYAAIKKG